MTNINTLTELEALRRMSDDGVCVLVEAVAAAAVEASIERFAAEDAERFAIIGDDFYQLTHVAEVYAQRYTGNFDYMVEMKAAFRRWSSLTNGQAKGVLNCMLAEARRNATKKAQAAAPAVELKDGMYSLDGAIYKVQHAVHGSGNQYAKRLVQNGDTWSFEYAQGAVRKLHPEHAMTLEEAKAFGALYGTCCVCGRTLIDEASIEAGIGPVCSTKFG